MKLPSRSDTIAAVATAAAPGAISVIRVSGPRAVEICAAFVSPQNGVKTLFSPRRAALARVSDGDGPIDDSVVTFFKSPASYTGEDVVEIACHGSPYITARILRAAVSGGARAAQPGEFTMRACLNGKLDLAQAQGVCDLITAETAAAHKAALNLAEGKLSGLCRRMRAAVIELLAQLEACLDDQDEDIEAFAGAEMLSRVKAVGAQLRSLAGTFRDGRLAKHGVRVALAGAPNAGKSSLLNALLGYGRAIVSPSPGTTRDTLEEAVEIEGVKFLLTDTAGIRAHALDPAEAEGMARTRAALGRCDIALFVLDASRPAGDCDELARAALAAAGVKTIAVLNKCDAAGDAPRGFAPQAVRISCRTGEGLPALKTMLAKEAHGESQSEETCLITSERHHRCLADAAEQVDKAGALLAGANPPLELAAEHLRGALGALADVAGETAADDVLHAVFSKFCVGK
ncbi:MAG: tRNA uridine-5-carboxymethylaminomethyl(34) synthesis GTPase MnmE [Elusimicrobiales bacterium]|nr:tRNA uridine-5-carboxymethylaminomethyl(34) synthesis GTPase MnmE [Elusimicrobiales bacterium]